MQKNPILLTASVILIVAFLVMLLAYGVRHSFPVFFPFILDEYNWARGDTALMFSIHLLVYGICAPFTGLLVTRIRARSLLLFGIALLGLAAAACSYATQLWHFYLLFGVLAPIGLSCVGSPVLNPTIMNWFVHRRGTALGLAQAGGGLSFVFVFLMEFVIEGVGWRLAYVVMGLITIGVLLPIVLAGYRFTPQECGLEPIGTPKVPMKTKEPGSTPETKPENWTTKSGLMSSSLWLLFISNMLFWGTGCYLVLAHQVKYAIDIGYSPAVAASTTAFFGVSMVIGQAAAFVSDHIGRENTVLAASILATIALITLIGLKPGSSLFALYSFAVLFGLGSGLYAVCVFVGAADIFSGRHFGLFNGIVLAGMGFGGAFGPWLGGLLFDIFDSYYYSFLFALGSFVLSFVAFYGAAPRRYVARGFG